MKQIRFHADLLQRQTGANGMRRFVNDVADNLDTIYARLGLNQQGLLDDPSNPLAQFSGVPPQAQFDVEGIDGKYIIAITNPQDINPVSVSVLKLRINQDQNQIFAPIIHQLQSATDENFNNASSLTTYGPSNQLSWEIQDPNQTKFWRLRSSFDGQNWNTWQIFSDADNCGPVGVESGFLRSTSGAPNMSLNTSNNVTVDSIDAGSNATIRIYGPGGVGTSWTHFDGQGGQTVYPSGTILGAAYNTDFLVVFNPATGFSAFPKATQYTNILPDTNIWNGAVHTVSAGGGGGTSGGGGSSSGGGGGGRFPGL